MPSKELTAALKLAEERNLRFVSLQFTDIVGQVKSVQVPMHQLEEAVEHGKWFDGSSIEGFARIAESDMFLVPDLDTFAVIPWEPASSRRHGARDRRRTRHLRRLHPNGEPFPGDPRWVLRRQVEKAEEARLRAEHRAGARVLPAQGRERRPRSSRCPTTRRATSTSPSDLGTRSARRW